MTLAPEQERRVWRIFANRARRARTKYPASILSNSGQLWPERGESSGSIKRSGDRGHHSGREWARTEQLIER